MIYNQFNIASIISRKQNFMRKSLSKPRQGLSCGLNTLGSGSVTPSTCGLVGITLSL